MSVGRRRRAQRDRAWRREQKDRAVARYQDLGQVQRELDQAVWLRRDADGDVERFKRILAGGGR